MACAIGVVASIGCGSHSQFPCTTNSQCVAHGVAGTCEPEGFCAFPDSSCPTGERFEPNAGNGLNGECVGATPSCGAIGTACCTSGDPCAANGFCSGGTCKQCVIDIAVGKRHTCAVKYDGTVWCTGANVQGQLGMGTVGGLPVTDWVQARDMGLTPITDATAIAAGQEHNCILRSGGAVSCWGHNDDGQLGHSSSGSDVGSAQPAARQSDGTNLSGMIQIAAADDSTCSLDSAQTAWCWGQNSSNQLGDGTVTSRFRAAPVLAMAAGAPFGNVASITMGAGDHACVHTTADQVWCWGANGVGQVGNNTIVLQPVPAHVFDGVAVAAGRHHTCGLKSDGSVWCWGSPGQAWLGRGPGVSTNSLVPDAVTDAAGIPYGNAIGIATGGISCAITMAGELACWGVNSHGQTGTGVDAYFPTPVVLASGSPLVGVKRVLANHTHVCAFLVGGELYCWGRNVEGELGNGTLTSVAHPTATTVACP